MFFDNTQQPKIIFQRSPLSSSLLSSHLWSSCRYLFPFPTPLSPLVLSPHSRLPFLDPSPSCLVCCRVVPSTASNVVLHAASLVVTSHLVVCRLVSHIAYRLVAVSRLCLTLHLLYLVGCRVVALIFFVVTPPVASTRSTSCHRDASRLAIALHLVVALRLVASHCHVSSLIVIYPVVAFLRRH